MSYGKLSEAAKSLLVSSEARAARHYVSKRVYNNIMKMFVHKNPVLGLKRPTPFREWLFEVWREVENSGEYAALFGWAVFNSVNEDPDITPLIHIFPTRPARGSAVKGAKDRGGWLGKLMDIVLHDVQLYNTELAVALAIELKREGTDPKEFFDYLYGYFEDYEWHMRRRRDFYDTVAILSLVQESVLLAYSKQSS